jgi:hypothetical protein
MNNQGSKYFSGFLRKHGKMSENDEKKSSHKKEGQKEWKILKIRNFWFVSRIAWETVKKSWKMMKESQKVETTPKKMKSKENNFVLVYCPRKYGKMWEMVKNDFKKSDNDKKRQKQMKNEENYFLFLSLRKRGKLLKKVKNDEKWRKKPKWMRNQDNEQFLIFL